MQIAAAQAAAPPTSLSAMQALVDYAADLYHADFAPLRPPWRNALGKSARALLSARLAGAVLFTAGAAALLLSGAKSQRHDGHKQPRTWLSRLPSHLRLTDSSRGASSSGSRRPAAPAAEPSTSAAAVGGVVRNKMRTAAQSTREFAQHTVVEPAVDTVAGAAHKSLVHRIAKTLGAF